MKEQSLSFGHSHAQISGPISKVISIYEILGLHLSETCLANVEKALFVQYLIIKKKLLYSI